MVDFLHYRHTSPSAEFKQRTTWSPSRKWLILGSPNEAVSASLVRHEIAGAVYELGLDLPPTSSNSQADIFALVTSPPHVVDPDLPSKVIVVGLAGEEADLLDAGASDLAGNVIAITCGSDYIRDRLLNSGVSSPVVNIGIGIDHWERTPASRNFSPPGKRYRFLHVSPCKNENGIDLLLEAFGRIFDSSDDVSLLVKPLYATSPDLQVRIDRHRQANPAYPDVILIQDDLSEAELKALYRACQVFLAPSRSEAFGVPIAQALISGLPVVTTAWGGAMDYCDADSCWLVDYRYEAAKTSHGAATAICIEPKPESLDRAIWSAYCSEPDERFIKARAGRQRLLKDFTWKDVALRLANVAELSRSQRLPRKRSSKIALLTTWNVRCGIGVYTEHLFGSHSIDEIVVFAARQEPRTRADERNVRRIWDISKGANGFQDVRTKLLDEGIDALVIQFNFGFFNHTELGELIMFALSVKITVIVDLHSTTDPYGDVENYRLADFLEPLKQCDRILVHNLSDMQRMKDLGLVANILLFPLGVLNRSSPRVDCRKLQRSVPLITSFGFCFDTKGLLELVEAMDILKSKGQRLTLRMLNAQYDNQHSIDLVKKIRTEIATRDLQDEIEFRSDYLDDETCLDLIKEADLFVNPYQRTNESASAAVRYGLATGVPVVVTPLPFFNDLGGAVFRMPGTSPRDIAEGINNTLVHLRENSAEARKTASLAQEWLSEHDYAILGIRLTNLIRSLVESNKLLNMDTCL